FLEKLLRTAGAESIAHAGGAPVLPHDGAVDGLAGPAIPHDGGFALVGDAHSGEIGGAQASPTEGLECHTDLRRPDFVRVVLDPAGFREELLDLLLGDGTDRAIVVKDDGAGAGRAFVE